MNQVAGRCHFLNEWPDWNNSIHNDESQIQRQGRAMTYPFSFKVDYNSNTAIFSSTSDLPFYETSLSYCTCHDFQDRRLPCKHIYRLAVELRLIEIINRPTYDKDKIQAIRASGDIDAQPDQLKRIESAKKAKCSPLSIDYTARTAVFAGSGKTPYKTTIDSCTCRDYFVRHLPCKHIYRLRMELENAAKE